MVQSSEERLVNTSFRLSDYFSIFQAEFAVVKVSVDLLFPSAASFREMTLHY